MADPSGRRNLVLTPNEFAHIQDANSGSIDTVVGPSNITLGDNDIPVKFNPKTKRFEEVVTEAVRQRLITAPAGWYVVLYNPAANDNHPQTGKKNNAVDLSVGKRIVVQGPSNFALWPGQWSDVIEGHRLRTNEYLVAEVYDAEAATANWKEAQLQESTTITGSDTGKDDGNSDQDDESGGEASDAGTDSAETSKKTTKKKETPKVAKKQRSSMDRALEEGLTNGKLVVIRGTEVAFFIPPTGVRVVRDNSTGSFVRKAVSLEKLEYAILLDESGDKEYAKGPQVVFPRPTQNFVEKDGKNKFRAYELDARKGIYVKVIEAYEGEDYKKPGSQRQYTQGQELFITGDGMIYFPRKEHSIIKYGEEEMHYAIAIPEGQSRYVLNRETGEVALVMGPKMFLPDPRKEVVTRRILSDKECQLYYPGNKESLRINQELRAKTAGMPAESMAAMVTRESERVHKQALSGGVESDLRLRQFTSDAHKGFGGDEFARDIDFTPPRTVILDTKYQGGVLVKPSTNFAIKVVDCEGKSRVVVGPASITLEYDEELEHMALSMGKPKTTDRLLPTVYLCIHGNKVSDIIEVVTSDLVRASMKLSYRVNFEAEDPEDQIKWFAVDNYVKFLCDHVRSVIKGVAKGFTISEFEAGYTEIIRDAILGKKVDGEDRKGMFFDENNMRIYDVDLLKVTVIDPEIQRMLDEARFDIVQQNLKLERKQRTVVATEALQVLSRKELVAVRETEKAEHDASMERLNEKTIEDSGEAEAVRHLRTEELEHAREQAGTEQDHKHKLIEASSEFEAAKRKAELQRDLDLKRTQQEADLTRSKDRQTAELALTEAKLVAQQSDLEVEKLLSAERLLIKQADQEQSVAYQGELQALAERIHAAKVEAAVKVAEVMKGDVAAAINRLGDVEVARMVAKEFGDLAVLEGQSGLAIAHRLVDGLGDAAKVLPALARFLPKGDAADAAAELDKTE
ncbi:hypothetical protein HOM83_04735 [Candidatus Falkowbacteria bacterium]|nr:hypothetical protein [Candidatus Falkowbacteria bacterium]